MLHSPQKVCALEIGHFKGRFINWSLIDLIYSSIKCTFLDKNLYKTIGFNTIFVRLVWFVLSV